MILEKTETLSLNVIWDAFSWAGARLAMSASLLERSRGLHEDLEVLERAMYRELGDPSAGKLKRADQIARDQVRPGCRAKASWLASRN